MRNISRVVIVVCFAMWVPFSQAAASSLDAGIATESRGQAYKHAVCKPLPLKAVDIEDTYWKPRIDASREKGTIDYLQKFEKARYIDNFRFVAEQREEKHVGGPNNNEFVYKLMEAAGYYSADLQRDDPKAAKTLADLNALVLKIQRKDGYLNTFYDNPLNKKNGKLPFQPLNRFEFYNFGHFTQAAIAWHRTSGDKKMLAAAVKFADLIDRSFAAPQLLPYTRNRDNRPNLKYEHPNHEMAMVELYRQTGDRRYLEFAKHTLDQYGFWDFPEIWGHAVQETLLLCGGADVYLEYGKPAMMVALDRLWNDMRERKMYIIGGVGSSGHGEAYGEAYHLPNDTAYTETCAAISLVMWNHRMLMATGESKYADCMERSLYNGVLSGLSLSGTEYFYPNPLSWSPNKPRRSGRRQPFFGCSCCPPNVHRLLGSLQQYIYTQSNEGIQVNLYVSSTMTTDLASGAKVSIQQQSDCPWQGKVELKVDPSAETQFALRMRIPGWVGQSGGPDSLYRFREQDQKGEPAAFSISVNGKPVEVKVDKGYALIDRTWKPGDVVAVDWPMPVLLATANEKVEANRGRVAIQRGPLVYCAEGIDNSGDVFGVSLAGKTAFKPEHRKDLLGGVTVLGGPAQRKTPEGQKPTELTLIPYYAWANREPAEMEVWLNQPAD